MQLSKVSQAVRHRLYQPVRRRVRRCLRRGGILMYHRIWQESCDPWAITVAPTDFADQMAVLAEARAVVDLAAFSGSAAYTRSGAQLAVTFDDGYVDNLETALPILERYEIPATMFVVGNAIGRRREFWWDALQRAILESGPLPSELAFEFGTGPHVYRVLTEPAEPADHGWRADESSGRTPRQRLFSQLWGAIVVLEPAEQDAAVDHLLSWAGQSLTPPPERLPVDAEQFAALACHPLVTIGNHTLDHASLPDLQHEQQRLQVISGHRRVQELTGRSSDRFSYPFGRYAEPTRAVLQELGIATACTSVPEPAVAGDDPLALPRLHATAMDGDQFARWLREEHRLLR